MSSDETHSTQSAVDTILELAAESRRRANRSRPMPVSPCLCMALQDWVETVTAVALVPAFGGTTLIHQNGNRSTIQSPDLIL